MANRNFNKHQSLEKEIKNLYATVAIGAAGAPTIASKRGKGIASIVRNGAGDYTITLEDKYTRLMSFSVMQEAAASEDLTFQVIASDVTSAKTIQFSCKAAAVETDPSNPSTLYIKVELKNSSADE